MSDHVFQGSSALALDAKGRVTVPARHRETLAGLGETQLTVTHWNSGPGANCLRLWPRGTWLRFRAEIQKLPMNADAWRNFLIGSATDVDIDSGSRVLISPEQRAFAGIEKDVLMRGIGPLLDLWDTGRLNAHIAATTATPMPDSLQNFVF